MDGYCVSPRAVGPYFCSIGTIVTFDDVCGYLSYGECLDQPSDLYDTLEYHGLAANFLADNLSSPTAIDAVKESLQDGRPIILRLEKGKVTDASTHFLILGGS